MIDVITTTALSIRRAVPTHNGADFTWSTNGGHHGLAFASDFKSSHVKGRVWEDACDEGFWIESHKTGRRVLFIHSHTVRKDGDVVSDVFLSFNTSKPVTITVVNT